MGERKIEISLDEGRYEKAGAVTDAETASVQRAREEFEAMYGAPSDEVKRRVLEGMKASGHFDPETPEHYRMRMDALARPHEPPPDELEPPWASADEQAVEAETERRAG